MKSKQEIEEKIKQLEKDPFRQDYDCNMEITGQINILKWVLGDE